MTTRRLAVTELPSAGGRVVLPAESAHHARVLRLAPGDPVELFDGRGRRARGTLVSFDGGACVCEIGAPTEDASRVALHLVQALPKGQKLDDIVRMATEIGVTAIHLVSSEHAVPRLDDERGERRRERLARIAREAARQAERDDVPVIDGPAPLLEVAARAPREALRLVACGRTGRPMSSDPASEAWIAIGPEGGLSEAEVRALVGMGYHAVTFGPTVLRVETAVPVALGLVLDRLHNGR